MMMMYCQCCGKEISQEAKTCPHCGHPIGYSKNTKKKNKWIAFILCFFLGAIGAHKFYEGKIGTGILYMFTGGLFTIGWIVDTIVLLTKPTEYEV